ncbi:MAG: alpha-L-fucosidase [Candidatus Hydrogenedentes bacterium]|nr:alpha-L-fucosidase [Candidatus Hydrogenedentota bacterium]
MRVNSVASSWLRRAAVACVAGLFLGVSLAQAAEPAPQGVPGETKEQRDKRMAWWREAKFGMFIHWGLYAVPGGVWKGKNIENAAGEWIMFGGQIPVAEYEPLVKQFNPVKFDAKEWVRIAKDAGCKYITITSKHHDGFCLFDSKLTDYDVMSTPFKRDIMKELADECHKQGIKICWYHSILDWHHPDYLPRGAGSPRPWDTRPVDGANLDRYLDYMKGELRELLTNYGQIGVIWFDGGWEHKPEELHSEEVTKMIRSIQPDIIINDRINIPQDFNTPEQNIPETGIPGRDWETCMTMNDTWGFKTNDTKWKSNETLIRYLVDIASKGGNFLLNVGPTAEGLIPQASVERLAAMGQWMKVNGDAIYGTTASPFKHLGWGRCTVKPGVLYLHVFDWPADGKLVAAGLKNAVKKAYLLSDAKKTALEAKNTPDGVAITVPAKAPDPIASVIALEIEGAPNVVDTPIPQLADGSVSLGAADAVVHGKTAKFESGNGKDNIGFWTDPKDTVSWEFNLSKAGKYQVAVTYACEPAAAGAEFTIECGGKKVDGKVTETANWGKYKTEPVGVIELAKTGKQTLTVAPKSAPHGAVMNLKSVVLKVAQ